ncbi:MAG: DUF2169 domain-containing protein [Polyangiaceae bacterium]
MAQAPRLTRDGAGLLQVGVLRWTSPPESGVEGETKVVHAGEPLFSIVVKATYSYARCEAPGDLPVFADEPEGLALDVPSALPNAAVGEIAYPSDFVPAKSGVDVLITGHAFSERPLPRLPAAVRVGAMARSFEVEPEVVSAKAPLIAASIRAPKGEGGALAGLGMALGANSQSAPPVGPTPTPVLLEEYPVDFDYERFRRAAPAQRMTRIRGHEEVMLTGLSERAPNRRFRLPKARPVAWTDTDDSRGIPLDLTCDTVWFDTDREVLVMVYRGQRFVDDLDLAGVTRITLALEDPGEEVKFEELGDDLARGAFELAVELSDFDLDEPPPPEPSLFSRYEMWEKKVDPTISLERYAIIAAALAEGAPPRAETLRSHGFDEEGFLLEERAWVTRMAETALTDEGALAKRFGELFVDAQDRLAGPDEGRETLEEYAMFKVDVEDAADPHKVLEERRSTLAKWMRMDRRWSRRAKDDERVEAAIDDAVAAYRARVAEAAAKQLSRGGA